MLEHVRAPELLAPLIVPVPETHVLLREMLRLLQEMKPEVKQCEEVTKQCEEVVTKQCEEVKQVGMQSPERDNTLVYVCVGVCILMTVSAINATVSSMRWESKYSKLVDRLLHMIHASNA